MDQHWPPYTSELSTLDFSFWAQVMAYMTICEPSTLEELKLIVAGFAANMKQEDVRKMAGDVKKKVELCRDQQGEHFGHLM